MLTVVPACTWQGRIEFYARAGLHNVLAFSGQYGLQHRQETIAARCNRPHPVHQALEEPSVFVVIAIAFGAREKLPTFAFQNRPRQSAVDLSGGCVSGQVTYFPEK